MRCSWCFRPWTPPARAGSCGTWSGASIRRGVALAAFKAPTAEEREHDFLWRIEKRLPDPGFIGVFDRSHYEDVLIGRVRELAPPAEIERRYDAINEFEARVAASGTRIVKVMLHISPEEQKTRLYGTPRPSGQALEVQPRAMWTSGWCGRSTCRPTRPCSIAPRPRWLRGT